MVRPPVDRTDRFQRKTFEYLIFLSIDLDSVPFYDRVRRSMHRLRRKLYDERAVAERENTGPAFHTAIRKRIKERCGTFERGHGVLLFWQYAKR